MTHRIVGRTQAASPVGIPVPAQGGPLMMPAVNPSAQYAHAGIHEVFLSKEEKDVEDEEQDVSDEEQKPFGFANVPSKDGAGLLVSSIDKNSLLADWNRHFPERAVGLGDHIVAVNNIFYDISRMRQELESKCVVLLIQGKKPRGANY